MLYTTKPVTHNCLQVMVFSLQSGSPVWLDLGWLKSCLTNTVFPSWAISKCLWRVWNNTLVISHYLIWYDMIWYHVISYHIIIHANQTIFSSSSQTVKRRKTCNVQLLHDQCFWFQRGFPATCRQEPTSKLLLVVMFDQRAEWCSRFHKPSSTWTLCFHVESAYP